MAKSLTTTDIVSSYGQYYENNGQNKTRVITGFVAPTNTLEGVRNIPTKETRYTASNAILSELLQGYQSKFTPKGGVEFIPNTIELQKMKVDLQWEPGELEDNWLGFFTDDNSLNYKDWPISKWMCEDYIKKQILLDKEMKVVYKGKFKAASPGVATAAADCMDGLKEKILQGKNNAKCPVNIVNAIGALDTTSVYEQITEFARAIYKEFGNVAPFTIYVAPEFELAYLEKKLERGYLGGITTENQITRKVNFMNVTVKGVDSMIGTTDMFATMPKNIIHVSKRNSGNFKLEEHLREVFFLSHWYEGIGFGCNKIVFATDSTVAPGA